jgi:hypothetical protein
VNWPFTYGMVETAFIGSTADTALEIWRQLGVERHFDHKKRPYRYLNPFSR